MIDIIINTYVTLGAMFIIVLYILWLAFEGRWDQINFEDEGNTKVINVDAKKAMRLLDGEETVVPVDVRPSESFARAHLPHALNTPFEAKDIKSSVLEGLSRETPLLLYCEGGFHSRCAIEMLKDMGFQTVYHLNRGFKSWRFFGGQTEASFG